MNKKFLNMKEILINLILMADMYKINYLQLDFLKNRQKKILSNTVKRIISKLNRVKTKMKSYYILN